MFLILQRLGRRALLLISLGTMSLSTFILAWSLNHSYFVTASTMIVAFVAAFSVGLGPVPFVLMGELPPPHVCLCRYLAALSTSETCLPNLTSLGVVTGAIGHRFRLPRQCPSSLFAAQACMTAAASPEGRR